jgi:predicted branched-subunit amino acid permease
MFYGFRNAPILKVRGFKKVASAQITIDESTGVSLLQEERGVAAMRYGFYATGIAVFIFWNLFTLLGALGAEAIGDPATFGLDAAVPAAFLGLVWPRLIDQRTKLAAAIAVMTALILTPFLPAGLPIITTVIIAIVMGWRAR